MITAEIFAIISFKVMGVGGASVIALLIMISTVGATNGNILPTYRVTYALAKDKVFFSAAGKVHKRFHTPYISLWLQCIWSCLFIISGSLICLLTCLFL
jgi:APA family basic amino acid/polyamine antiporter